MPYIDMREHHFGVNMLQLVCKNYKDLTKTEVKRAILAHKVQLKVAYPIDEGFKFRVHHN